MRREVGGREMRLRESAALKQLQRNDKGHACRNATVAPMVMDRSWWWFFLPNRAFRSNSSEVKVSWQDAVSL